MSLLRADGCVSTSDLGRHCHPLYHSQGPRQARHVPRVRISAFVDGSNKKYSVFVDDWRCSPEEVNMTQRTYTGWTAFVYQLPDALEFLF